MTGAQEVDIPPRLTFAEKQAACGSRNVDAHSVVFSQCAGREIAEPVRVSIRAGQATFGSRCSFAWLGHDLFPGVHLLH